MKSPSAASRAASSGEGETLSSLCGPHAVPKIKPDFREAKDVVSAPFSPCSNEGWENLMNWDHTEKASAFAKSSVISSTSAAPLTPRSGSNITPRPHAEVNQTSGLLTESRKRKSFSLVDRHTDAATNVTQSEAPVFKRSHNAIEKRYRTNLNHKITALRDAIPSIRKLDAAAADDVDGLNSAPKLNKATVLSKAIEYIQFLEGRNQRLEEENATLKECMAAMEQEETKILRTPGEAALEVGNDAPYQGSASVCTAPLNHSPAFNDPQGMIRVPEDIKRLRQGTPQAHYHERSTRPLPSSGGIEVYLGAMLRMP